jgi:hypothetical protein
MEGTNLLIARRTHTVMPLPLGKGLEYPVTISFTLQQCPQQAQRSMLQVREPAIIRLRPGGSVIDDPILLLGPLPKGLLPDHMVNSGAKLATFRRSIHDVCRAYIGTRDVRLVGKYDKGRSPIFLYLEFPSVMAARQFGSVTDHEAVPAQVLSIFGKVAGSTAKLYTCTVPAEVLAGADEKTFRTLVAQADAHPCPNGVGAGADAGAPDNPEAGQH